MSRYKCSALVNAIRDRCSSLTTITLLTKENSLAIPIGTDLDKEFEYYKSQNFPDIFLVVSAIREADVEVRKFRAVAPIMTRLDGAKTAALRVLNKLVSKNSPPCILKAAAESIISRITEIHQDQGKEEFFELITDINEIV